MASDLLFKTLNTLHQSGWSTGKMPVVELTTTGRKSGEPRTVMVTSPWQDGDTIALVASAWGNDAHPAWLLNLRDDPSVTVRTTEGERPMTARIVEGDERVRMWEQIIERFDRYAEYQSKTDRQLPVVLLEPAS
ncbi:MAG: nitroreductase family deazaflavin-dependent oxidoreductase [Acidimicrobiales bacterium]